MLEGSQQCENTAPPNRGPCTTFVGKKFRVFHIFHNLFTFSAFWAPPNGCCMSEKAILRPSRPKFRLKNYSGAGVRQLRTAECGSLLVAQGTKAASSVQFAHVVALMYPSISVQSLDSYVTAHPCVLSLTGTPALCVLEVVANIVEKVFAGLVLVTHHVSVCTRCMSQNVEWPRSND